MTTTTTHPLDSRWNGPAGVANGGFAAGAFAKHVGGTATVRLVRPPLLGLPLTVCHDDDGVIVTATDDQIIARVRPAEPFVLEPPVKPTFDMAIEARLAHPLRGIRHPLSDCVVCGPERDDGLGVTSGYYPGRHDTMIAPFEIRSDFAVDGLALIESVWGALDCPSYPAQLIREGRFALAGELTGHVLRDIAVGEQLVCVGWQTNSGNRSHHTATAIIDGTGRTVASARAVWVELA